MLDTPAPDDPPGSWRRYLLLLLVTIAVAVSDQTAKRAVERHVAPRTVHVLPGFDLRYTRNPGAAWGLLANVRADYRRPFFVGVSALAMVFVLVLHHRAPLSNRRLRFGLSLILGGALGNFIDRVADGSVVDFIDWHAFVLGRVRHWPTFNIADAAITVGVVLFALELLPRRARPPVSDPASEEPTSS